jgi:hypothetical protein
MKVSKRRKPAPIVTFTRPLIYSHLQSLLQMKACGACCPMGLGKTVRRRGFYGEEPGLKDRGGELDLNDRGVESRSYDLDECFTVLESGFIVVD